MTTVVPPSTLVPAPRVAPPSPADAVARPRPTADARPRQRAPRRVPTAEGVRPRRMAPSLVEKNLSAGIPVVAPEGNLSSRYLALKRAADLIGALVVLALLAPIMLLALVVLAVTTKGKPFFVQDRVGYLGRRFPMIKFRTMRLDAEKTQHLVKNEHESGPIFKNRRDPRITRVGRILRRTSIDETPQLINVLLGHMSLVGPRPPAPKEVLHYQSWQRRRLAVMPGLTCLWQISGRSEIGFEDWVRMDLWYVRRQGLWTDLQLLLKTPWSVLSCRGAY